ncbi:MAG: hypothetical protein ACTSU8_05790 [Alphaproteobacteria bacterium]
MYFFLMDELPFCQALAFWHCKKWESDGIWTVLPYGMEAKEAAAQASRIVENIRQGNQGKDDTDFDPDLSDGQPERENI